MTKFAVFDIDGTLIRWQLYHVLVSKLADQGLLGPDAGKLIKEARQKWKNRVNQNSFKDYENQLINIFTNGIKNLPTKKLDGAVDDIIQTYKNQTYVYTKELLKTLKSQGYTLIAISGSHQELVNQLGEYYGFDIVVASEYKREAGKFNGQQFIPSIDKKSVLQGLIKKHNLDLEDSYAIGDSQSDASMLEMVKNPIAFNPDLQLLRTARNNGWKIVIERKNVIYQLESQNGKYILA